MKLTIQTRDGQKITGTVQGNGGTLKGKQALKTVRLAIKVASRDEHYEDVPFPIYAPKPNHVKIFTGYSKGGLDLFQHVSLVGATVSKAR